MSGRNAATEGALLRGADRVGTAHDAVLNSLGRIDAELDEIRSVWDSAAASQYAAMLHEWGDRSRTLNRVLAGLQESLRATHGDQTAVAERNEQAIGSVAAMLGGTS